MVIFKLFEDRTIAVSQCSFWSGIAARLMAFLLAVSSSSVFSARGSESLIEIPEAINLGLLSPGVYGVEVGVKVSE
jgi:hypothetical protein